MAYTLHIHGHTDTYAGMKALIINEKKIEKRNCFPIILSSCTIFTDTNNTPCPWLIYQIANGSDLSRTVHKTSTHAVWTICDLDFHFHFLVCISWISTFNATQAKKCYGIFEIQISIRIRIWNTNKQTENGERERGGERARKSKEWKRIDNSRWIDFNNNIPFRFILFSLFDSIL